MKYPFIFKYSVKVTFDCELRSYCYLYKNVLFKIYL